MKCRKRSYVVMLAALAGAAFAAAPVMGQMRVNTNGQAMDANPQVGSGGYNNASAATPVWNQYQNALVTNNARNGFAFRGPTFNGINLGVGYTDPFAFRGLIAGQGVDQFIANSVGVPTMADPTASSSLYAQPSSPQQIYYGVSNHSVAPPGSMDYGSAQTTTPGFVSEQPVVQSPQDIRLGTIDYSGQTQILPKPDQIVVPGPVDSSVNPSQSAQQLLSGSALWGTVQLNTDNSQLNENNSGQSLYNSNNTPANQQSSVFGSNQGQGNSMGGSTSVGPVPVQSRIREIRQELTQQNSVSPNANGSIAGNANGTNSSLLQPLQPGGNSFSQPLGELNSSNSELKSGSLSPTAGDVSTDQSNRTYLPSDQALPPPTQQSALYAKLRQNMEEYDSSHSMTDEQANQKFQEIRRLQQMAQTNAESGADVLTGKKTGATQMPGGLPNGIPSPDESGTNGGAQPQEAAPGATGPKTTTPDFGKLPTNLGGPAPLTAPPASPAPVTIDSFATGIKSKGLADLIGTAEQNVEQQRYDRAIANYNEAIDAAPNNPLIVMARATAELGGGYYAQANADIHVAVAQDPAILLGQYDLQKHLGPDRLKSLITDLKQISEDSPDDTLHSFLLSFVYYNSHHLGQASQWLENTDKRSGGQDSAISNMKRYWNFAEPPAPKPYSAAPAAKH